MGPQPQLSALQAADLGGLAAYIGVCPTCLGWDDPEAAESERNATPGRPVCPTCGLPSVEWDLSMAIDEQLTRMRGLDRLDEALREGATGADGAAGGGTPGAAPDGS